MIQDHQQTTDQLFHFDETSAIWQINRERILLLTGAKVLLMQIAHPMVAEAVYNHSYVFKKPLLRLHRTLTLTLNMVFGTRTEVQTAIDEIDRAHRPATGTLSGAIGQHAAGSAYNPRNPKQARWVHATLVEGAISGYETLVAPLSTAMKDNFVQDSVFIADAMGIPQSYLSRTYADLVSYMEQAITNQEVIVGDSARKIAPFITAQSIPLVNLLSLPLIRFNVALLPPKIQAQYGYHINKTEQTLVEHTARLSRSLVPRLPEVIRFAPEYHRAMKMKQTL